MNLGGAIGMSVGRAGIPLASVHTSLSGVGRFGWGSSRAWAEGGRHLSMVTSLSTGNWQDPVSDLYSSTFLGGVNVWWCDL